MCAYFYQTVLNFTIQNCQKKVSHVFLINFVFLSNPLYTPYALSPTTFLLQNQTFDNKPSSVEIMLKKKRFNKINYGLMTFLTIIVQFFDHF